MATQRLVPSVPPAILVEFDPEALWHAWRLAIGRDVAGRARRTRAAAAAGRRPFPRALGVVLANPVRAIAARARPIGLPSSEATRDHPSTGLNATTRST
jgi:hypothetical protein